MSDFTERLLGHLDWSLVPLERDFAQRLAASLIEGPDDLVEGGIRQDSRPAPQTSD